ncbi:SusF/SusE family outer membrane protein [Robertkochia solimangrovi]|uniref:SusF/SusE family outer membrane protein n=1 Tax=Robertkochia solimangrovi TaxID=2213046 RepID=UPI001181480C|nr:SusF/SusE family outer membrane protein [Robertkochia solimangrovi]TRZ43301.1 DUF5116 domain-containing protein [Robertkochia solimangrovi]
MNTTIKNLKIWALAIVVGAGFTSCDNEDYLEITAQEPTDQVMFTNSTSSAYLLSAQTADNVAERFVWNEPSFDAPTPVNYKLEGSITETFDAVSYDSGTIQLNNQAVLVSDLMDMAEELGLDNDPETTDEEGNPNNSGTVYFRVTAFVGEDGATNGVSSVSETVSLNITLLESGEAEEILTNLYLVGNATAAGWNPDNNNTPLFRDPEMTSVYYFTGYFAYPGGDNTQFKMVEVPGMWQPQWGLTEDGTALAVNDGTTSDPAAFEVSADGYYSLMLNLEDNTYTYEAYDASGAVDYTTPGIGIIGDATAGAWDSDTEMTQSVFDPHIWYLNDQELGDGEMKFRTVGDWGMNWGGSTALSGLAVKDGANIPITAGIYNIWFNDIDGRYILIPAE